MLTLPVDHFVLEKIIPLDEIGFYFGIYLVKNIVYYTSALKEQRVTYLPRGHDVGHK